MADQGGGDAWLGRPEREAAADTGSLSDSDSDWDAQEAGLSPGEPPCLEEAASSEDDEPRAEPPQPPAGPARPFHLRGTSPTFSLRSRSIFGGLDGAARTGPPAEPPARVPDYVTHPERWTRYSLEDVAEGSDRSNRAVAVEFLGELRRRAGGQGQGQGAGPPQGCAPAFNQDPSSRGAGRIVFSRPVRAAERKRPPWREPDEPVVLGHLGAVGGPETEAETEEPSPEPPGAGPTGAAGFHGSRKRSREHLRPKGPAEEESEEA
ncbi:U5 small nuclear ribonucleoprotein TSSC4 [Petaurus breviceps papuanus]|uniref:U5 small nuclear ribonucleoprotein TSSC4 n=1 Tax=Petaurus breviceps papuanus TaxID=3040969 RepID=UPI0036DCC370